MKKSLNDALVLKDGFNIRTSLKPCKYIIEGCPYLDTSLSSTRQALERHELRCPILKANNPQQWFDNCRYICACKKDFDISYFSKHYKKSEPAQTNLHHLTDTKSLIPRASKATTQHSIMFLHFTCTASKDIRDQRLRSCFKNVPEEEYNDWYKSNVASKSEQDIATFVNTARSFPFIDELNKAHTNNHKYPNTNKYCSRAEEYLYSNVQKIGLFIIDNVIEEVIQNVSNTISKVDHAEEFINTYNDNEEFDEFIEFSETTLLEHCDREIDLLDLIECLNS